MSQPRLSAREILVLVTVACAQLLVILDTTIVNIAVPLASAELSLGADGQQWIITAYALTFGAILLIGGRVADYAGRKRTFLIGIAAFGLASVWGGLAQTGAELLIARALQGGSAALLAPAALSIMSVAFPAGRARAVAFGLMGAIMSSGAALGLILGGVLTEYAGWRWCLFINVPFAAVASIFGIIVLRESRAVGRHRYDIAGALTVALGLAFFVFGLTRAEKSLIASGALPLIAAGLSLLAVFVLIERSSAAPLLPLRIILHRARGGAMLVQLCSGAAMIGVTLYVTLHLQQVLNFTPLLTGLASLPLAAAVGLTMPFLIRLIPRIGLKPALVGGPLIAAAGIALLGRVSVGGTYLGEVLPGLIVMGVGMACIFAAAQNLALLGVDPEDSGAAAAASNAANQIGGALGLAVLTNIFVAVDGGSGSTATLVRGYSVVFLTSAGFMILAALVAGFLIKVPRDAQAVEDTPDLSRLH